MASVKRSSGLTVSLQAREDTGSQTFKGLPTRMVVHLQAILRQVTL